MVQLHRVKSKAARERTTPGSALPDAVFPQYIYVGDEDGQLPLWSELSITPQPVVQKSIDAHRKKGIQTFVAAQIIVDSYNDNFNLGEPVTLDLFVADDVAEEVIIRWNNGSGADELGDDDEASDEEQD